MKRLSYVVVCLLAAMMTTALAGDRQMRVSDHANDNLKPYAAPFFLQVLLDNCTEGDRLEGSFFLTREILPGSFDKSGKQNYKIGLHVAEDDLRCVRPDQVSGLQ